MLIDSKPTRDLNDDFSVICFEGAKRFFLYLSEYGIVNDVYNGIIIS